MSRLFALALGGLLLCACKGKAGEACRNPKEARCADTSSALMCSEKVWTKLSCLGPKGCRAEGSAIDCDESFAAPGEFCERDDNVACSADKKSQLRCDKGSWRIDSSCRGPEGCQVNGEVVRCDDSLALEADACFQAGHASCSVDRQKVLVCRGRAFVTEETCKTPSCVIRGKSVACN
jgi:hypothetical protein